MSARKSTAAGAEETRVSMRRAEENETSRAESYDTNGKKNKPVEKGNGLLTIFLGGLLLLFNVSGVMLAESAKNKETGKFLFNTASAVVVSEFAKLVIASIGFVKALQTNPNIRYTMSWASFLKYGIPGLLYAVCNVGNYEVLKYLSSSLYQVFNNMKIVTTAIVFRLFLKKKLKMVQWVCLAFLTIGMLVTTPKNSGGGDSDRGKGDIMTGLLMMVIMSCASSLAGVYNEFLLKSSQDDTFFQSMQLYIWGVVICLVRFNTSATDGQSFFQGYTPRTWAIIFCNALYGQVVALVFKYADNIVKVYANSLAALSTAFLSYIVFGSPLTGDTLIGSLLVGISVLMYYGKHELLLQTDEEVCCPASSVGDESAPVAKYRLGNCYGMPRSTIYTLLGSSAVILYLTSGKTNSDPNDPVLGLLKKYDDENFSELANQLKAGCKLHVETLGMVHSRRLDIATRYFKDHKLDLVFSDDSALAMERFDMIAAPWQKDVVAAMGYDDVASVFTMALKKVHPAYEDVTTSSKGQAAFRYHCQHESHKGVCSGFRVLSIVGTNDCLSFEALTWGFAQVRYHPNCQKDGAKVMDVWMTHKCRQAETKACKTGAKTFKSYLDTLNKLKTGQKTKNGLSKDAFGLLMGKKTSKQLRNGVKVPVLVDNKRYLSSMYGSQWHDTTTVCATNVAACNAEGKKYTLREVLTAMAKISDCETAMGNGR